MHFATSSHGTVTVIEALTEAAQKFFFDLGFKSRKIVLGFSDFKELRYAASSAGFFIEVSR